MMDKQKLFKVEIHRIVIVEASDQGKAICVALDREVDDVKSSIPDYVFADLVTDLGEVPECWHDAVPYNDSNLNQTSKELLFKSEELSEFINCDQPLRVGNQKLFPEELEIREFI